jgi:hypothetical protein
MHYDHDATFGSTVFWQAADTVKLYIFYFMSLSVPIVAGTTVPLLSNSPAAQVLALRWAPGCYNCYFLLDLCQDTRSGNSS